jgi:glutathione S-transferase
MRLFYSPASPFSRMARVVAYETGLAIELVRGNPTADDVALQQVNPLSKIPVLVLGDGQAIHDSRVICEYLDTTGGGAPLTPSGPDRWAVLTLQATGVGLLDTIYDIVLDGRRPAEERSATAVARWRKTINRTLDALEVAPEPLEEAFNIAHVALACALGYLDFRLPDVAWRDGRPRLTAAEAIWTARPSVATTKPQE